MTVNNDCKECRHEYMIKVKWDQCQLFQFCISWFAASYFLMTSKYHKHTGPVQRASAGRYLFSGTTTVSFGLIFTGLAINSIFFAPPHLINTMLSMLLSNNISLIFNCYFNCIELSLHRDSGTFNVVREIVFGVHENRKHISNNVTLTN